MVQADNATMQDISETYYDQVNDAQCNQQCRMLQKGGRS
jgi:hypothetical protein